MQKGILTLSNAIWNAKRRYKVNSVVKFGNAVYQNSTGRNSSPDLLTDWVLIKDDVSGTTQLRESRQIYTSGAQEFTLPEAAAQIVLITVNGAPVYDYTILSDTLVRVDLPLVPTVRVVIHYLVDLNLDTAPYYTQAQVDALIASAGGGGTSGEWTPTASALVNLTSVTPANAYWSKIGNFVTLNFSANIVLAASGLLSFELTVPTAYPIALEDPNIGNGVLQNNGFTPVLCQTKSNGTEVSIQSKATVSGSLNAMIHINLTYKTT